MYKIYLTILTFLLSFTLAFSQENNTSTITVTVSNLKSDKGSVFVALYDKEENFLGKAYEGSIVKITDKKAIAIFKDVPNGEYAISVFHDENDNKKLDTNFMGIPKEALGCSNGATGFMGPPKYKDAKFTLTKDTVIPVKVK